MIARTQDVISQAEAASSHIAVVYLVQRLYHPEQRQQQPT